MSIPDPEKEAVSFFMTAWYHSEDCHYDRNIKRN
jgi:hypothetical protein